MTSPGHLAAKGADFLPGGPSVCSPSVWPGNKAIIHKARRPRTKAAPAASGLSPTGQRGGLSAPASTCPHWPSPLLSPTGTGHTDATSQA